MVKTFYISWRSVICCKRLAESTGRKMTQKFAICAPPHNVVDLYLRNWDIYRQSEKNLLNINISFICPHNMVNFDPLTAEIDWRVWGTPANFNGFLVFASLLHRGRSSRRWTKRLALSWAGTQHVNFRGLLPHNGILPSATLHRSKQLRACVLSVFGRPFVKRFALCYRTVVCPVCLSCPVCNVGVSWPNVWSDQDETWHAGRPRPWQHCVRWGPRMSPPKATNSPPPIFGPYMLSPNGSMDQDATWYEDRPRPKRHCVRLGPSSPFPQMGTSHPILGPCLLWPNGYMDQDATWYGGRSRPRQHCARWGPSSPFAKREAQPPTPIFGPCLWPNGWMDQDGTWHGAAPRLRRHCVTWCPSSP